MKIISVKPAIGQTLNGDEILTAEIEYRLADNIDGYDRLELSVMFYDVGDYWSFAGDEINSIELTKKAGTVSISYPLSDAFDLDDYMHPLKCHFTIDYHFEGDDYWTVAVESETVEYAN